MLGIDEAQETFAEVLRDTMLCIPDKAFMIRKVDPFFRLLGVRGIFPITDGIVTIQINVIYAAIIRRQSGDHLVLLLPARLLLQQFPLQRKPFLQLALLRRLALGQLRIRLFQFDPGVFLVLDLPPGSSGVANEKQDDQSGDAEDSAAKEGHVVSDHVPYGIGIQLIRIAKRQILRVIGAQHVDPTVKKTQQSCVTDLNAEASVVVMRRLEHGKAAVTAVAQDIVCSQSIQGGAAHTAFADRLQAVVDRGIERDLGIRIMGQHKVVLHAVVLIDRKMSCRFLRIFSAVNQLRGGRYNGCGLENAAFLGII